jgi:predicted RNase H-like HicB family nuclease
MWYPVYVHPGDETHAHGVTVPDFPSCFSAANDWQDLPRMIQEAIEVWCEGQDLAELPGPAPLERLAADPDYQGGVWMLVEVDTGVLETRPVRLNISLPSGLARRIDDYAKARHMTRSGFLADAARRAME